MKHNSIDQRNTTILDGLIYTFVMILANIAGYWIDYIISVVATKVIGTRMESGWVGIYIFGKSIITMLIVILLISLYFKYKMPDYLPPRDRGKSERALIWCNFKYMVLPAEIFRFIIASLPLFPGKTYFFRMFDGALAFPPNYIYGMYCLDYERVKEFGYTFLDNLCFVGIYLLYFVIHVGLLTFVFYRLWRKVEDEQNKEIRITMDPSQMK